MLPPVLPSALCVGQEELRQLLYTQQSRSSEDNSYYGLTGVFPGDKSNKNNYRIVPRHKYLARTQPFVFKI